jgi:hypothetical protein
MQGYDGISFDVKNKEGSASRRLMLIKNSQGNMLELSNNIPTAKQKTLTEMFQPVIDTAKIK